MTSEKKSIREFIYVDVDKLYSFYSQVFEGLTEHVINEKIDKLITGDSQHSIIKQGTAETKGIEESRRVESSILHDHMYNRLEAKLGDTMIDGSEIESSDIEKVFSQNPIIKISGRSEIEDYQRISIFMEKFNQLGEYLAYASLVNSPDFKKQKEELQNQFDSSTGKEQRKQILQKIEKLRDPSLIVKKMGLSQDPKLLEMLKFWGDLFNPTGYDIVITPSLRPNIHYRGVLDKVWLRNEPRLISSLYGGQSEAAWSMVGIITNLPGTFHSLLDTKNQIMPEDPQPSPKQNKNSPMILDAYRNMFRTGRAFERMFLESEKDFEIVVSPLAIYREFPINVKSQGSGTDEAMTLNTDNTSK